MGPFPMDPVAQVSFLASGMASRWCFEALRWSCSLPSYMETVMAHVA